MFLNAQRFKTNIIVIYIKNLDIKKRSITLKRYIVIDSYIMKFSGNRWF